jgi:hypothetical protein
MPDPDEQKPPSAGIAPRALILVPGRDVDDVAACCSRMNNCIRLRALSFKPPVTAIRIGWLGIIMVQRLVHHLAEPKNLGIVR